MCVRFLSIFTVFCAECVSRGCLCVGISRSSPVCGVKELCVPLSRKACCVSERLRPASCFALAERLWMQPVAYESISR